MADGNAGDNTKTLSVDDYNGLVNAKESLGKKLDAANERVTQLESDLSQIRVKSQETEEALKAAGGLEAITDFQKAKSEFETNRKAEREELDSVRTENMRLKVHAQFGVSLEDLKDLTTEAEMYKKAAEMGKKPPSYDTGGGGSSDNTGQKKPGQMIADGIRQRRNQ